MGAGAEVRNHVRAEHRREIRLTDRERDATGPAEHGGESWQVAIVNDVDLAGVPTNRNLAVRTKHRHAVSTVGDSRDDIETPASFAELPQAGKLADRHAGNESIPSFVTNALGEVEKHARVRVQQR